MILFLFNIQIIQQVLVDNHATTTRLVGAETKAWLCKLRLLIAQDGKEKETPLDLKYLVGVYKMKVQMRERERKKEV